MYPRDGEQNFWGYRMEFYVLNEKFEDIGVLTEFESFILTRRYYEPGKFELHVVPWKKKRIYELWNIFETGKYICRSDNEDTYLIDHIHMNKQKNKIFAKGRTIEAILNNVVARTQIDFSGTHEEIVRAMVEKYAIGNIKLLKLGKTNNIGKKTTVQVTGQYIGEKIFEIMKEVEASIKIVYDYETNTMTMCAWKGIDRTENQAVNTLAIFSTDEGKADLPIYDRDFTDYRNFAYIAGEGEGLARTIITIDNRKVGEDMHEVWIDARDLQKGTMTDVEYKEALNQRGVEKMTEYHAIETVDAEVENTGNLVYRKDFDIGDLCTYRDEETGIEVEQRITEVTEIYEKNTKSINIIFGEQKKTNTIKLMKGVI